MSRLRPIPSANCVKCTTPCNSVTLRLPSPQYEIISTRSPLTKKIASRSSSRRGRKRWPVAGGGALRSGDMRFRRAVATTLSIRVLEGCLPTATMTTLAAHLARSVFEPVYDLVRTDTSIPVEVPMFRFSLRTLLVAVTLVGAFLGWLGSEWRFVRGRQAYAVRARAEGGTAVTYPGSIFLCTSDEYPNRHAFILPAPSVPFWR